jgi:hypothetical protein
MTDSAMSWPSVPTSRGCTTASQLTLANHARLFTRRFVDPTLHFSGVMTAARVHPVWGPLWDHTLCAMVNDLRLRERLALTPMATNQRRPAETCNRYLLGSMGRRFKSCQPDHCQPDHCQPDHCQPDHCQPDHCQPDHCQPDGVYAVRSWFLSVTGLLRLLALDRTVKFDLSVWLPGRTRSVP